MEITKTQSNSIQQFSALNSFRANKNVKRSEEQPAEEVASGVNTSSSAKLLDSINVNEIRECAKNVGEYNITDEDIKYGIMYGRSVIAEWLC